MSEKRTLELLWSPHSHHNKRTFTYSKITRGYVWKDITLWDDDDEWSGCVHIYGNDEIYSAPTAQEVLGILWDNVWETYETHLNIVLEGNGPSIE